MKWRAPTATRRSRSKPPCRHRGKAETAVGNFFGVFLDPRAYTSLFFMLLSLATGIIYFVFAVVGLSLSAGLAVLIIGVPFFLMFMAISRVVSLAEGRLIEAMTGERMPRRPVYQGNAEGFWARIGEHAERPAHLDHHRILHPDAADRHRLLRHRGGGTVGEPGVHLRAACRHSRPRRGGGFRRNAHHCARRGGMDGGVGFRAAAADAAGSLAADLDHASGARRRTAARRVREGAAGRTSSTDPRRRPPWNSRRPLAAHYRNTGKRCWRVVRPLTERGRA